MNDVLVTLLFGIFVFARQAWMWNGALTPKPKWQVLLADAGIVACTAMVTLMWIGVFCATWIVGLVSLYGSFVLLGETIRWEIIPSPFRNRHKGVTTASQARGRAMKAVYHLCVAGGIAFGFVTNDVGAFAADICANVARVDDESVALSLARQCYESRYGARAFLEKPFVVEVGRNYYRYRFGVLADGLKPDFSDKDSVVILVDRRTGEARFEE
jgi:hypothetical protein